MISYKFCFKVTSYHITTAVKYRNKCLRMVVAVSGALIEHRVLRHNRDGLASKKIFITHFFPYTSHTYNFHGRKNS